MSKWKKVSTKCFDDPDIDHVEDSLDPIRDVKIVEDELILSDLISAEEQLKKLKKEIDKDKDNKEKIQILEKIMNSLMSEKSLKNLNFNKDEEKFFFSFEGSLFLLWSSFSSFVSILADSSGFSSNREQPAIRIGKIPIINTRIICFIICELF